VGKSCRGEGEQEPAEEGESCCNSSVQRLVGSK